MIFQQQYIVNFSYTCINRDEMIVKDKYFPIDRNNTIKTNNRLSQVIY